MKRPACGLLLLDLANPCRYLELRGDAQIEPDPDYAFADRVAAKYGADLRNMDPARRVKSGRDIEAHPGPPLGGDRSQPGPGGDIAEPLADPRLVPSGISDPRSAMSAGNGAEGYVRPSDVEALMRDYLMAESAEATCWLIPPTGRS